MAKTRILYYGDAPVVATGFGTVSRNILVPLYNTGDYDITVLGINYWGDPHKCPFPIWPVGFNKEKDPYGRESVQHRIANSDFDILMMTQDSFILEFIRDFLPQLKFSNKKFKSIVYFPIDGVPKKSWVEAMAVADYPVTYTQYGYEECIKACESIKNKLRVVPHGINAGDFYPISYGEMWDFRRRYFGPMADKFIVTNVNRNQQRKDIPRTMFAFREFLKKCPNSVLYLHMAVRDQGWNLDEVCTSMDLVINRDVIFPQNFGPNQGFPVSVLNKIYNASDVVVSSTTGEGWGLAQVEAMATRTPIISPDNTACSEIVGKDRGLLVRSGHDIDYYAVLPNDNEVCRPLISVSDMADALEKLYNDEVLCMKLGEAGYEWITNNLVWDKHITKQWKSIVEEAANSLFNDADDEYSYDGAVEV
jgi:glycosyltransferase involved in cell wall biosynthesis